MTRGLILALCATTGFMLAFLTGTAHAGAAYTATASDSDTPKTTEELLNEAGAKKMADAKKKR